MAGSLGCEVEDCDYLAADGVRLHSWWVERHDPAAADDPVLLFFHGNAGNLSDRAEFAAALADLEGDDDDDDCSGVLRYVSIRHAGTEIGEGNEINGLTLGGVGRETDLQFIEIFQNQDDGVEFFGGTVNARNLVLTEIEDDSVVNDISPYIRLRYSARINNDLVTDVGRQAAEAGSDLADETRRATREPEFRAGVAVIVAALLAIRLSGLIVLMRRRAEHVRERR